MYLSDFIEDGLKWDIKMPKRNLKLTEHNTDLEKHDATMKIIVFFFSIHTQKGSLCGCI